MEDVFRINIISPSYSYPVDTLIAIYHELLTRSLWYGWRMDFCKSSPVFENGFVLSGGNARFPSKNIQFVSVPLACKASNTNIIELEEWGEGFDMLIEVVDLSLITDENYPGYAGEASYSMEIMGRGGQAMGLFMGAENWLEPFQKWRTINFEEYTTQVVAVHSAMLGKDFHGVKMKKEKKEAITAFWDSFFYRYSCPLITENGNELKICPRLFFHHQQLPYSGFIESIYSILKQLYKSEIPQGILINQVINNNIYNHMCFDVLKRFFGRAGKTVKIAVVGQPDSGKTHLLVDMVQALKKMGYDDSAIYMPVKEDKKIKYQNFSRVMDFSWEEGKTIKTTQGRGSQRVHYRSQMMKDGNKAFILEFMNIPGERFKHNILVDTLREVVNELLSSRSVFKIETWSSVLSKDVKLLVNYDGNKEYNEVYQTVISNLEPHYKKEEKVVNIDGEELWKRYYEFDAETTLGAIVGFCKERNLFETTTVDDNGQTIDIFLEISDALYYYRFLSEDATDVVFCDRLVSCMETTENDTTSQARKEKLLRVFGHIYRSNQHIHHYFAYRGLDALIKRDQDRNELLTELFGKDRLDDRRYEIYAFLMIMLGFICNTDEDDQKELHEKIVSFFKDEDFDAFNYYSFMGYGENQKNKETIRKVAEVLKEFSCYDELVKRLYGEAGTDYHIMYNSENKSLAQRIVDDLTAWNRELNGKPGFSVSLYLPFPPHVYFTAFPINDSLIISRNVDISDIKEDKGNPNNSNFFPLCRNSLYLGTNELVLDILHQNGIFRDYNKESFIRKSMFGFGKENIGNSKK